MCYFWNHVTKEMPQQGGNLYIFFKKIKPGRRAVNLSLYILIGSKEEEEVINLLCGCMI